MPEQQIKPCPHPCAGELITHTIPSGVIYVEHFCDAIEKKVRMPLRIWNNRPGESSEYLRGKIEGLEAARDAQCEGCRDGIPIPPDNDYCHEAGYIPNMDHRMQCESIDIRRLISKLKK